MNFVEELLPIEFILKTHAGDSAEIIFSTLSYVVEKLEKRFHEFVARNNLQAVWQTQPDQTFASLL